MGAKAKRSCRRLYGSDFLYKLIKHELCDGIQKKICQHPTEDVQINHFAPDVRSKMLTDAYYKFK